MKKEVNKAFSLVELSIVILIIGVLIAAVGQGIDLLRDAKLNAARTVTQSSRANSIKDIILWLDATSEKAFDASEAVDGNPISTWYDTNPQSVAKNNVVQSTTASKPLYYDSVIDGLPAVYFDGTDDTLASASGMNSSSLMINNDFTLFFVVIIPAAVASYHASPASAVLFEFFDAGGLRNINVELGGTSTLRLDGGTNPVQIVAGATSVISNSAKIFTGYRNRLTPATTFYLNGSQYATAAGAGEDAPVVNGKFVIGSHALSYYFKAYVGEILLYGKALSTKDRKAVEAYLGKKWNIKVTP